MTPATGEAVPAGGDHAPDAILLGFARALRAAGVAVTADRERTYLQAVAEVGAGSERGVYGAGRATLCGSPADLERYDQVYAAWFGLERAATRPRRAQPVTVPQAALDATDGGTGVAGQDDEVLRATASDTEVLRHRDVAALSPSERARLSDLFAHLRPRAPHRRAHRWTAAPRGSVDAHRTLRDQLRRMGEPGPIAWRRRGTRPRRIVLLVDVSGSMSGYADSLLRLAHAYATSGLPVEVFTLGTRLTHVTRALHQRDADRALASCGDVVPDWAGGTRLAEGVAAFLDRWGRRGMARGAVVVLFSDGWERSDPAALGEQMRRLRAVAHRVVWVNPHRGKAGYQPVQQGVVAALPHVDDFVAGHSMATFEELVEVVARA